jgi:hypothetical protein
MRPDTPSTMLRALIAGETKAEQLAELAQRRLRK